MNKSEFLNMQKQVKNAKRSRVTKQKVPSDGEQILATQLKAVKIEFEQEYRFHPVRRWKADFKIENYPILVEVEGGTWSNGRHTRGKGFEADCEKYNQATILGFHVLRGTTAQVKSGELLKSIEQLIQFCEK